MLGSFLCNLVNIYLIILLARVVISYVTIFKPGWSPPDALRPILDFMHMITDPPREFLRSVIPPLRSGAVALDLAFLVYFIAIQWAVKPILCRL